MADNAIANRRRNYTPIDDWNSSTGGTSLQRIDEHLDASPHEEEALGAAWERLTGRNPAGGPASPAHGNCRSGLSSGMPAENRLAAG